MLDRLPLPSQLDRVILLGGTIAALAFTPILIALVVLLIVDQISAPELVFWLAFTLIVAGALGAVLLPNIVHAALSLVLTLLGISAIYLLLGQEFLALAQILVYGGGVTILLVFGLMMTNAADDPIVSDGSQKPFAAGVAILLGVIFAAGLLDASWGDAEATAVSLQAFGTRLFDGYVLPFIIVGVLLDVALSGALLLARPDAPEPETEEAAS
ncbi:MAG: NADH-quinone oxidoreductase subunit J [Dehalococcoidia bacterium]